MRPPTPGFTLDKAPTIAPAAGAQVDFDALAKKYGGKRVAPPTLAPTGGKPPLPAGFEEVAPPQQASDGRLVLPPTPPSDVTLVLPPTLQPKTVSTSLDELSSPSAKDGRFLPVPDGCALVRARDGPLLLPWNCVLPGFPMDREPPAEAHHSYIFWRLDQLIVRGGAGLLAAFGIGVFVGQTAKRRTQRRVQPR